MGTFAASTVFSNDTGPAAGAGLESLALNQKATLELEGAQAPISCTIADGSISPTASYVIVDTEGSAAADDLTAISPVLSESENLHDGMIIYLKAADSGRVVTVKNSSSANGINTYDGNDYVLSTTHWLKLQLRSGKWYEVEGRAMEAALAAATAAQIASTPATTTARGIGRVAANADLVDGATINNGPAFIAAGVNTSVAAAAGKVPVADSNGKIDAWVSPQTQYAACATASATAAKDSTLAGFSLVKGARVFVTFSNANTVAGALTLNVNSTGAKSIYNERGAVSSTNVAVFPSGVPIEFVYDGTYWRYVTLPTATKLLSTCTTTGDWAITGCIIDKPLLILMSIIANTTVVTTAYTKSGAKGGTPRPDVSGNFYAMGNNGNYATTNIYACIPTDTTVVLGINIGGVGNKLEAFQ
jgi:hypothetical protein